MKMDKTLIRKHFDRHAHEYDHYTVVQKQMVRRLMTLLKEQYPNEGRGSGAPESVVRHQANFAVPMSILEIGCGTGRLTAELLEAFPHARITVLDLSERMLEETRRRAGPHADRVRFVTGDAERLLCTGHPLRRSGAHAHGQLHEDCPDGRTGAGREGLRGRPDKTDMQQEGERGHGAGCTGSKQEGDHERPDGQIGIEREGTQREAGGAAVDSVSAALDASYDLIASSATFQWLNDPFATMQACLKRLAPSGVLAFATFGPATFHELHYAFAAAEKELGLPYRPHGQAYLSAADWKRAVMSGSWSGRLQWREELHSLFYPTVRTFLRHVQRAGAGNALALPGGPEGDAGEPANHPAAAGSPPLSRKLLTAMEQAYRDNFSGGDQGIRVTYEVFYGLVRV
ncbi:methyltransferase [Paenibacillus sp. y28]|uniref:methyltransferase n=1 Tax=Paenibacillus sp. y28 TaxID=3129110 RepID=UPI00301949EC